LQRMKPPPPPLAALVRVVGQATGLPAVVAAIVLQAAQQSVFAFGGSYGSGSVDETVDRFDTVAGVWTAVAPMQTRRHQFAAVCLEGLVYAVGGHGDGLRSSISRIASVERYDPAADAWSFTAAMNEARSEHCVCVLNGRIYAMGGIASGGLLISSVEVYDSATNGWTLVAPMQSAPRRAAHAACVLDGCIFASGGYDDSGALSGVQKYDPPTDSWRAVAPMQRARHNHAMTVLDGHIYAAGGTDAERSVERYDAAADSWSSVADMARTRHFFALCVVNGRLTAVGGENVEQYDAATDTWSVVPRMQMPTTRERFALCVVD
jgi:N-acetylneuraminic acid mutarotase